QARRLTPHRACRVAPTSSPGLTALVCCLYRAPVLMARRLRRYKLTGLPRLTREQVRLLNGMMAYLPAAAFEADFKDKLRQVIEPLVHADIDLWFDGITRVEPGKLPAHVTEPTCIAFVAMLPKERQMLVEVDLTIAQQAVDRMLGGTAEDVD